MGIESGISSHLKGYFTQYYGGYEYEELTSERYVLISKSKGVRTGIYLTCTSDSITIYRTTYGEHTPTGFKESIEQDTSRQLAHYINGRSLPLNRESDEERSNELRNLDKYVYNYLIHNLYVNDYPYELHEYIDAPMVARKTGVSIESYQSVQRNRLMLHRVLGKLPTGYHSQLQMYDYISIPHLLHNISDTIHISTSDGEYIYLVGSNTLRGGYELYHHGLKRNVRHYREGRERKQEVTTELTDSLLQSLSRELTRLNLIQQITRIHLKGIQQLLN